MQCPKSGTDVTRESTAACHVQKQTPRPSGRHTREYNFMQCTETDTMSHKRAQRHTMSRIRHRCHTREHNFMQCPETDTDVTQENTTSCNVENQTQMSHKRTREHNFMQCRESDTDVTQENTTSCNVQKQTPRPSGRHTREHNIRQVPGTDRKTKPLPEADTTVLFTRPTRTSFKRIPEKDKMSNRKQKFRQVPGNDKVAVVLSQLPPEKGQTGPTQNLCFRKKPPTW